MRFFVDGFVEGFTGAGMFFGPRPQAPAPLLAEETEWSGSTELFASLHQLFDTETSPVEPGRRAEIAAEIKTILGRVRVGREDAVKRGSFQ